MHYTEMMELRVHIKEAIKDAFREIEAEKIKTVKEPVKSEPQEPKDSLTDLMEQLKTKKTKKSV